jgi:hypothetical protein
MNYTTDIPERHYQRRIALAQRRSRQEHAGDVEAGNGEQHAHAGEEHEHRCPHLAREHLA